MLTISDCATIATTIADLVTISTHHELRERAEHAIARLDALSMELQGDSYPTAGDARRAAARANGAIGLRPMHSHVAKLKRWSGELHDMHHGRADDVELTATEASRLERLSTYVDDTIAAMQADPQIPRDRLS